MMLADDMDEPWRQDPARWTACLELRYALRAGKTVLVGNRHSGPLVVQRPLYPEGGVCHTCILHPPGGVVGGDRLELDLYAGAGSSVLLTTPGATKFYRSASRVAEQRQKLTIDHGAFVEWFPQDSILFPGAQARIATRVDLGEEAHFMGWEVVGLGMPAMEERFCHGSLAARLSLFRNGTPLFLDRLLVRDAASLDRPAGLRAYPVTATFVATGCDKELLAAAREIDGEEGGALFAVSLLGELLVARYLGYSCFAARALFIRIWERLRPHLAGRDVSVPRIWAT